MEKRTTKPCSQSSGTVHPMPQNNIISSTQLRQQIEQNSLTCIDSKPGVYRWWFPEDLVKQIFEVLSNLKLPQHFKLQEMKIDRIVYVALYFGMSGDLGKRIRQHVKGPFSSSTLRRTLRAILAHDVRNGKRASEIVNDCINKCYWQWDTTVNEEAAKKIEKGELCQQNFAYPLNIQGNHTVLPTDWLTNLKRLRKTMK